MEIIEINDNLLVALHTQAADAERKRMNYDLRTTSEDTSQRMLNALEVGTKVPIHRHLETSETIICLHGSMDVAVYDLRPNEDCFKLQRTIYCVNMQNISNLFGGMKEKV